LVLGPLTVVLARLGHSSDPSRSASAVQAIPLWVIGPLWFPWALLLFSIVYAIWRKAFPQTHRASDAKPPSHSVWLRTAFSVGVVALCLRQFFPVGQSVLGLQLGYFSSYVFLFAVGCAAASRGWMAQLTWSHARGWFFAALVLIPVLPLAILLAPHYFHGAQNFSGGFNASAFVYAFWEPLVAWGIIAALLVLFRERFNAASVHWDRWGRQAYGAFFLHAPLTVALSLVLSSLPAPALIKFLSVGLLATLASFYASGLLLKSKWMQRIF
jgi:hypothetical protein